MASSASVAPPKITTFPKIPSTNSPQSLTIKQRTLLPGTGRRIFHKTAIKATAPAGSSSPGLYSAQQLELNPQNVDLVLEEVRPYLIADGGNVDVVSVEDDVISLKLQGACGDCPSSTTTMKMGIERVLKEKFGDAVKDILQVSDEESKDTTAEAVNDHLDILRPAITNFGGSVEVLSVENGECRVEYTGPESIGSGIKAAIKEKFSDIVDVVFVA
ncbi:PREDICTED: nifU-like protein 1, chloroplastic [Populus euphratica]|uniref:NifU-like protein 1, chloroplastic n=1 Tax=Populus euphratica TaxID=75702 RepID=A0AAJ6X2A8_POPEU|nr:PREDICTED: nifU-like protein 1, chloroplastic [Populus euphratica]